MDVYFQQISSMATSCIIGVEYQNQEMDMGTVHNFTYTNGICICTCVFSSVQLLSCVWLFENPYTGARQTSLSITNSRSLLKLMFIELLMPSNPSNPLWLPSPPTFNLSQNQGLFKWVSSSHQVAKVLEFQLQHQSFQKIFKVDFL